MPRVRNRPDNRPIEWMFVNLDELKPLSVVRDELLRAKRLEDIDRLLLTAESPSLIGLTGRILCAGEAPPF